MIRILVFIAFVLALGFGFSWLAERPGELSLIWQGQRVEMTLMVAATLIVGLFGSIILLWWLARLILTSPQAVTRYFRARKRDRGHQALSTGLIAVGAGDAPLARKMLDRSRGLIRGSSEPLLQLLDAQTAMIEGRTEDARQKFEAMAEDPETRELGLRGLYLEAQRLGAHEAARHYAEKAVEKAPHLPWAAEATLAYRTQAGRYDEAIRLLEAQRVLNGMDKKVHHRKKAVLLAGRALSKFDADPRGAREDAVHALKLAPDLVPAATIAARAYLRENNRRKAMNILEQAWRQQPHAEIASAYVAADGGSATDKLRRAERLEQVHPGAYEALYAVASAALDAREFGLARSKAEEAARFEERESIYLLMADIEEAETGDQARVRHWLAQALRAPRDPEWVADGQASDHWLPITPASGRLDAFEWKRAFDPPARLLSAHSVDEAFGQVPSLPEPDGENEEENAEPASPAIPVPARQEEKPRDLAIEKPFVGRSGQIGTAGSEPVAIEPFNGRPPDDPGVKDRSAAEPNRYRLF